MPVSVARCLVALACALCSACVPFPAHVYLPDPAGGTIEASSCTIPQLPYGIRVEAEGMTALVSLHTASRGDYVEVRYDVPVGRTLVLAEPRVRIDGRDGSPRAEATFPKVSPFDSPASNYDSPVLGPRMLAVDSPLAGRLRYGHPVHYWIAARFAGALPDVAWVELPPFSLDGRAGAFAPVRFDRKLRVILGVFNC